MNQVLTMADIQQRLCGEIETLLARPAGSVAAQTALASLGMDSLQLVSLLVAVEKRYGTNLLQSGLKREHLATVASLAAAVHAAVARPA